jgi:cellulose synthase/poly-beta-1,6-N-acetylglucosamine synthase-like glycosyltransferase
MIEIIFWVAVLLILYTYAIYPVALFAAAAGVQTWRDLRYALGRGERRVQASVMPPVSIVIPAYNEERVIEAKLRNALSLDYPADKLEVIVVSDGSTDRTNEIVRQAGQGVKLIVQPTRGGKPAALNRGIAEATGEIVVITDANTLFDPAAVRYLVRHFADGCVGVVLGDLHCTASEGYESEQRYWDYERALKFLESRIGAVLGGQGGIYAIRRACYRPIPAETWVDDFVIGMHIRDAGYQIVYDTQAVAFEETTTSVEAEFVRKARIAAGNFQALASTWRLLNPLRGTIAFSFWSHKVLRWLAPFFMIAVFIANIFLLHHRFYQVTFSLQVLLYGLGVLGRFVSKRPGLLKIFALPYYFLFMNAALVVGLFRCVTSRQRATWQRTERQG